MSQLNVPESSLWSWLEQCDINATVYATKHMDFSIKRVSEMFWTFSLQMMCRIPYYKMCYTKQGLDWYLLILWSQVSLDRQDNTQIVQDSPLVWENWPLFPSWIQFIFWTQPFTTWKWREGTFRKMMTNHPDLLCAHLFSPPTWCWIITQWDICHVIGWQCCLRNLFWWTGRTLSPTGSTAEEELT